MQLETKAKDFLEDIQIRYNGLKKIKLDIITREDIQKLNDFEKSYQFDMIRLIDEIKALRRRHEDFVHVLNKVPSHELIDKVKAGHLSPEDKLGG